MSKQITVINSRKEKLQQLIQAMQVGLLEREPQVKLTLLAALSGEHLLLIGPPGTAKSELAKRLKHIFVEANYFERLLTRFTVPEEVFGPLSIKTLEEDRYTRLTSGYLPSCSVAFLDEIFKANSAILNSLLTILNERQFDNGNTRDRIPLISVIAASNELPEGEDLSALYDRFMLRSHVLPVSDEKFLELLTMKDEEFSPELNLRLRVEDLTEVQTLARKVHINGDVLSLIGLFRTYLNEHDITVSDRRWRKIIKLLRVSAFTNNQTEVSIYDAWLLPHCLWEKPEQLIGLIECYKNNISVSGDFQPTKLTSQLNSWEGVLREDTLPKVPVLNEAGKVLYINAKGKSVTSSHRKEQQHDNNGNKLYKNSDGEITTEKMDRDRMYGGHKNNEELFNDVANEQLLEPKSFTKEEVNSRVNQVQSLVNNADTFHSKLQKQSKSVENLLKNHLWADQSIIPEITNTLSGAISKTQKIQSRAEKLVKAFKELPIHSANVIDIQMEEQHEEEELNA
jgi:MoxR-like ATPase